MEVAQASAQTSLSDHPIYATSLIRRMIGGSRAALVEANDGLLYVVKTWGNCRHPNMLANEFLGYSLCAAVGLPVAVSRPIELSQNFLDRFDLSASYEGYTHHPRAGLHYASRLIEPPPAEAFKIECLATNQVDFVQNRPDFLGMYILDFCMKHRDTRQAIFIKRKGSPTSQAVFIDHGHMFGGSNWEIESPVRPPCHTVIALYHGLLKEKNVSSWIKAFDAKLLYAVDSAVKHLPPEWYTGNLTSLQTWLHHRIESLPRLINQELEKVSIFREPIDATMHLQASRICQVRA